MFFNEFTSIFVGFVQQFFNFVISTILRLAINFLIENSKLRFSEMRFVQRIYVDMWRKFRGTMDTRTFYEFFRKISYGESSILRCAEHYRRSDDKRNKWKNSVKYHLKAIFGETKEEFFSLSMGFFFVMLVWAFHSIHNKLYTGREKKNKVFFCVSVSKTAIHIT